MTIKLTPAFTAETAQAKIRAVEDLCNSRDPEMAAMTFTEDAHWRYRDEFIRGRDAVRAFLTKKWQSELHYQLKKELWSYSDNRISVRSESEWQDADSGQWYHTYSNENWEFADDGLMCRCDVSANDTPIAASERLISLQIFKNTNSFNQPSRK